MTITAKDMVRGLRDYRTRTSKLCRHYTPRGDWAECADPRKSRDICRSRDGWPVCGGWPGLAEEER